MARTGKLLNVTGAYDSEIFNPAVDDMTGYTTHTLLCAPLIVQGKYVCCNSVYMLMTVFSFPDPAQFAVPYCKRQKAGQQTGNEATLDGRVSLL